MSTDRFCLATVLLLLWTSQGPQLSTALGAAPAAPAGGAAAETETPRTGSAPFPRRLQVPDFPKDAQWLNTGGPLRKQDLKGKFVLLDFWTYCCINCMHILPELKKLERAFPNELVVIGVHSAKFETERNSKNVEEAVLRYHIEHPVLNDPDHRLWEQFGVQVWPTVLLLDPEGLACWGRTGEIQAADVEEVLRKAIPYYRAQKLLDTKPLRFELLAERQQPTPLRFPGKVLADEPGGRLFISDSSHHRIVIATLDGDLREVIGAGSVGAADGRFATATFHSPQGLALQDQTLYVADTENHLLRKVDLVTKTVTRLAGTGSQRRGAWPGANAAGKAAGNRFQGPPLETALNSPWDLWRHQDQLFIAMAGPHQIWKMTLDEQAIGLYAGNGREDIVDGALLPPVPYELGFSSFAQPSGLASDGKWLYVADSEGSSIRAVPLAANQKVKTVVGTAGLASARLFTFGDRDGEARQVLLQHPLGVTCHDGLIYVADTYNNKIKAVDAQTGATKTVAGTGAAGASDDQGTLDEPAGLAYAKGRLYIADTNNHRIRIFDLSTQRLSTLEIKGLAPPTRP